MSDTSPAAKLAAVPKLADVPPPAPPAEAVPRWAEKLTEQTCPTGQHRTWYADTERNLECPWCAQDALKLVTEDQFLLDGISNLIPGDDQPGACWDSDEAEESILLAFVEHAVAWAKAAHGGVYPPKHDLPPADMPPIAHGLLSIDEDGAIEAAMAVADGMTLTGKPSYSQLCDIAGAVLDYLRSQPYSITLGPRVGTGPVTTSEVYAWHTSRFGEPDVALVAGKLAEETGEVCGAIVKRAEGAVRPAKGLNTSADWTAHLHEEIGDVGIVLNVLAGREGTTLDALIAHRFRGDVSQRVGQEAAPDA